MELESKLRIEAMFVLSNSIKDFKKIEGFGYAFTRSVIAEFVEHKYNELKSRASLSEMDRLQIL